MPEDLEFLDEGIAADKRLTTNDRIEIVNSRR